MQSTDDKVHGNRGARGVRRGGVVPGAPHQPGGGPRAGGEEADRAQSEARHARNGTRMAAARELQAFLFPPRGARFGA